MDILLRGSIKPSITVYCADCATEATQPTSYLITAKARFLDAGWSCKRGIWRCPNHSEGVERPTYVPQR